MACFVAPWYFLYGTPAQKAEWIYGGCPFAESIPVAEYLRVHTRPDDTIYIFGSEPQILFYAARPSASRYIFAYPLMTPFGDTRERQHGVIRELYDDPPSFIVWALSGGSFLDDPETPPDLGKFIARFAREQYVPVGWVRVGDDAVRPWPDGMGRDPHRVSPRRYLNNLATCDRRLRAAE